MSFQRGITSTAGSYGKIQSYEANNSVQIAEIRDENGEVSGTETYDEKIEVSFEYVFSGTAPKAGDTLTVTDGKIIISSVRMIESNQDWKRMNCTGVRYVKNSLPA